MRAQSVRPTDGPCSEGGRQIARCCERELERGSQLLAGAARLARDTLMIPRLNVASRPGVWLVVWSCRWPMHKLPALKAGTIWPGGAGPMRGYPSCGNVREVFWKPPYRIPAPPPPSQCDEELGARTPSGAHPCPAHVQPAGRPVSSKSHRQTNENALFRRPSEREQPEGG